MVCKDGEMYAKREREEKGEEEQDSRPGCADYGKKRRGRSSGKRKEKKRRGREGSARLRREDW